MEELVDGLKGLMTIKRMETMMLGDIFLIMDLIF